MSNTTSLAPGSFSYDTTVYIVLNDFGKFGHTYVETEREADEAAVISDIISGAHPLRVVAFNTYEGWSRDVTEDIAGKILDLNRQGTVREFVERVTGESPNVFV
jgi:hypothetical protein